MHRPHVVDLQSDKRLGLAGGRHELYLQAVGLVHLYNGPKIFVAKTSLGRSRSSTTVSRGLNLMSFPLGTQSLWHVSSE